VKLFLVAWQPERSDLFIHLFIIYLKKLTVREDTIFGSKMEEIFTKREKFASCEAVRDPCEL